MKLFERLHQRWKSTESIMFGRGSLSTSSSSEKVAYHHLSESSDSLLEKGSDDEISPASRSDSSHTATRWRSSAAIIAVFAFANIAFLISIRNRLPPAATNCRPWDVSDSIFPRYEYEQIIFHDDHIEPTPEADQMWDAEGPRGNGFTIIDDPGSLRLPPGTAYGDGFNNYGVSWAHQYHCVWMLRKAFFELVNGTSPLADVEDMHEKSAEGQKLWHLAHCFGYLRQHILCNMDMTIEWPVLGGSNQGVINGYEIPHQCRKRQPLDEYMDLHAPDLHLVHKPEMKHYPTHKELTEGHAA